MTSTHTHITYSLGTREKQSSADYYILAIKLKKNDRHDFNETYFSDEHDYQSAHIVDVYEKQDYK